MTIGKRILVGYFIVLSLSMFACGGGLFGIVYLRGVYGDFITNDAKILMGVVTLRLAVEQQSSAFRGYMLYREPAMQAQWKEAGLEFEGNVTMLRSTTLGPEEVAALGEIEAANREWRARQEDRMNFDGQASAGAVGALDELDERRENSRDAIMQKMQEFYDHRSEFLKASGKRVERELIEMILAISLLALLALLAGVGVSLFISRSIGRTLREAIGRLASSTAEISAMTRQVASGAAETAAAVSETSSTVEEVKQTATLSAQKAKTVSQSAQRSVEISESGRGAVEDSMRGMEAIRAQMELVAQCVIRLSEQGQAIGDIIATVNDLADQSNLLAVNASIEAARAGEHGRGFGVVAQEVKSLAEQSKLATAQVRAILGEVQRATGSAVMATEQGNKAVEAGVVQATAVGTAIRQLSSNIADAAQSATQIAASSQQQLAGMDQVALAMEDIRQASRQNAAGTVQSERAAEDLKQLAGSLRSLIESNGARRDGASSGGTPTYGNE